MGRFMIVSKVDKLDEYVQLAKEYGVAFELNDFFEPEILDDEVKQQAIVTAYKKQNLPENVLSGESASKDLLRSSTLHGAFYDIAVFSQDKRIRDASEYRMKQSMDIARQLGVHGVVFHTNYYPELTDEVYQTHFVDTTSAYLELLLQQYPDINIYLENMFDRDPQILKRISMKLEKYSNYGVCLDWAHANIYGGDVDAWVESIADYVKHIHINDNDLMRDLHLRVGNGKIDWDYFCTCYQKYFTDCSVLIETNEPDDQRASLEYILGKMKF